MLPYIAYMDPMGTIGIHYTITIMLYYHVVQKLCIPFSILFPGLSRSSPSDQHIIWVYNTYQEWLILMVNSG